ncbi:MAG: hypothetical protein IPJ74_25460 [Saprospiraceae bacterium]|nr:hypothetical protein [Saprospiraceae bacterium]
MAPNLGDPGALNQDYIIALLLIALRLARNFNFKTDIRVGPAIRDLILFAI